ncbi:MAG: ABC transporter substrate-binding protein, partial [Candidatus Latescibacterota bacterium]
MYCRGPAAALPALLVLLTLGLLACGGSDGSAGQVDAVLVFGRGSDSVGLDPALETDGESMKVCDNLYENLVTYASGTTEVVPQLAQSWDVSDDGLRWTFHLRTGVRFHDGTPFNADAVLFSLGRQFFQAHPFHKPSAGTYSYWKDMSMDAVVADMRADDDSTFVIELAEANAPFLSNLGMNFCAIVSPSAVRRHGADYFKNPVGTGPFRFVEWRKDERIVLGRNDDYWGEPASLDRLVFKYVQDPSVRFLELRSGAVHGIDNVSPEFTDAIRQDPGLDLLTQPGMNVGYLAMNMELAPFGDVRVRRAVNHAVNKQALVENFYAGLAVAAVNP